MKNVLLILILLILVNPVYAQLTDSPWPTFHGNSKHTGVSAYPTNIEKPYLKWRFDAGQAIETSPAIGVDETIYFGALKNNFYALNPDGTEKWRFTRVDQEFRSNPTIAKDGTIYFASLYNIRPVYNVLHKRDMEYGVPRLYALNPDGTEKWQFEIGGIFAGTINAPLVDEEGIIYIGAGSNYMTDDAKNGDRFIAIYPNGTEKWSFSTADNSSATKPIDGTIYSSAALSTDETIIFGCANGNVYSLYKNGKEKWRFTKDGYFDSSPAIANDGTVYISSTNQNLYAISSDGKEKWHFKVNDFFETNPSIGKDGTIYFGILDKGVKDHNLYALNPNGSLKWKFETEGGVYSTPAIDSNGVIYFGSYDHHVYSLNPDGSLRWKFRLGGPIVLSPSMDKEGTLYFGTWDNHLYAIDGTERKIIPITYQYEGKKPTGESCGDNVCDLGEEINCRDDCGLSSECDDGICDQLGDCPSDCGEVSYNNFICGNGICEPGEIECHDDCRNKNSFNNSEKNIFEKIIDFFMNMFI